MNRIEEKLTSLQAENKKAFITYMTAGLPSIEGCKNIIKIQEAAGTSIVELGIPFSDPVADGPIIQAASYKAILQGMNLKKSFQLVKELRQEGCQIPIVFMMYFNTISYFGIEEFVAMCNEVGVDGLIIPDLPFEEQDQLTKELDKSDKTFLIQLVAPVSGKRIPMITRNAKGFIYCVSSMGVTGQSKGFHKDVLHYLEEVKKASPIPVMMGFGIQTAADVKPMIDVIDGAIVGSHFIDLMEKNEYKEDVVKNYCETFVTELNSLTK